MNVDIPENVVLTKEELIALCYRIIYEDDDDRYGRIIISPYGGIRVGILEWSNYGAAWFVHELIERLGYLRAHAILGHKLWYKLLYSTSLWSRSRSMSIPIRGEDNLNMDELNRLRKLLTRKKSKKYQDELTYISLYEKVNKVDAIGIIDAGIAIFLIYAMMLSYNTSVYTDVEKICREYGVNDKYELNHLEPHFKDIFAKDNEDCNRLRLMYNKIVAEFAY